MAHLSSVLHFGPGKLISEFDGGSNFIYLGTISRDVRGGWDFPKETCASCVYNSISRMEELPLGGFRTNCLIRALVHAVDTNKWDQVNWVVLHLPREYSLYTDNLLVHIMKTGVVSAIRFAMSIGDRGIARDVFRVASIEAVRRGHHDAVKFLYNHFEDDGNLREDVVIEACKKGDTSLIKWLSTTRYGWPADGIHELLYKGQTESLEYLKGMYGGPGLCRDGGKVLLYASLGGHLETVEWAFNNTVNNMGDRDLCLMVSRKGLLDILKYLICNKGLAFNKADCIRFAKRGSGIREWLLWIT